MMQNTQSIAAVLYGRFSDDKQDMERQERMFDDYCSRNNLTIIWRGGDPATSGSVPFLEREFAPQAFEQLQAAAQTLCASGRITRTPEGYETVPLAFVTTEQDRIGRDTLDIIFTLRAIWNIRATPHFVAEGGAIARTPENELRVEIRASVAQYELNKIRQRIRDKLRGKRAHHELIGSLSYGWNVRYVFADGHELLRTSSPLEKAERELEIARHGALLQQRLEDNPEEQKWILHMAWRRHHGGWSYPKIANELNVRGVKSKRAGEVLRLRKGQYDSEVKIAKSRWQFGTVESVLNNATVKVWLQNQSPKPA
jgi:DNA invertase Pin-like site-specific DNA recombinase